ncbi:MAG: bacteriohemerythrin [Planctomycetota bacterium]|jgi:hemerythrin-like metal-binding protein
MIKSFKHGIRWQDHQHEQLLTTIAALNKSRRTLHEEEELVNALNFLEFYIHSHFELEERYMTDLEYPGKRRHILDHKDFIHRVSIFRRKALATKDPSELVTELCDWLKNHILTIDKELAGFLQEKKAEE